MQHSKDQYYVPEGSYWPILGSVGMALLLGGFASSLHGSGLGAGLAVLGLVVTVFMVFGWMGQVVSESEGGYYNQQVGKSFRIGMGWFIFSEVMFFAAFFGAMFYAREFSIPWLAGEGNNFWTGKLLWPEFSASWPLVKMPSPELFAVPSALVHAWGIPAINTMLLLASGATLTWAHWALYNKKRDQLIYGMIATITLGVIFLGFQAYEYAHAYGDLNLKMTSGVYGSTFYLLTGFHGFHVTLGTVMLICILMRIIRGHFTPENHFAFEAVAWYWHFVDVVWLGLFIYVYWFTG